MIDIKAGDCVYSKNKVWFGFYVEKPIANNDGLSHKHGTIVYRWYKSGQWNITKETFLAKIDEEFFLVF